MQQQQTLKDHHNSSRPLNSEALQCRTHRPYSATSFAASAIIFSQCATISRLPCSIAPFHFGSVIILIHHLSAPLNSFILTYSFLYCFRFLIKFIPGGIEPPFNINKPTSRSPGIDDHRYDLLSGASWSLQPDLQTERGFPCRS
jgi:hypothetical protein